MRLASTEVFAVSQDVGHKMIKGEYGAREAYEDFNNQITDYSNPEAEEVKFTQKTAYSNDFGVHGSQAASSLNESGIYSGSSGKNETVSGADRVCDD